MNAEDIADQIREKLNANEAESEKLRNALRALTTTTTIKRRGRPPKSSLFQISSAGVTLSNAPTGNSGTVVLAGDAKPARKRGRPPKAA